MKASILIVEDEKEIADLIALYLKKEGIDTIHAESGEAGLYQLDKNQFDLVLLDINLPGIDGFEVLQEIRKKQNVPVMIISARRDDSDMILGFGVGADDWVTKPFSPKVLTARIRARLRRPSQENTDNLFKFGPYTLDLENFWLKKNDERIVLPPKEMGLLLVMADKPEKAFKQDELYSKVWGNSFGDPTTVSVHIQRLRKKLEKDYTKPEFIMTAYGSGYYIKGNN